MGMKERKGNIKGCAWNQSWTWVRALFYASTYMYVHVLKVVYSTKCFVVHCKAATSTRILQYLHCCKLLVYTKAATSTWILEYSHCWQLLEYDFSYSYTLRLRRVLEYLSTRTVDNCSSTISRCRFMPLHLALCQAADAYPYPKKHRHGTVSKNVSQLNHTRGVTVNSPLKNYVGPN